MSPIQQLAEAFAVLAEKGTDTELECALGLCLGFSDMIIRELNMDAEQQELDRTGQNPIQRLN
jgi:hypothetical protein